MRTRRNSGRRAVLVTAPLLVSTALAAAQVNPMLDGQRRGIPNPEHRRTVFADTSYPPQPLPRGAVTHAAPVRAALLKARQRRVDIVGHGDSNQTFSLFGWTSGFMNALLDRGFEMYASALMCQNQRSTSGFGFGMPLVSAYKSGERASRNGAPAFFETLASPWDPVEETAPFDNHAYCFAPDRIATSGTGRLGMRLDPDLDVIGMSDALRFHLMLGRFAGAGDGQLIMEWRDWTNGVGLASKVVATEGATEDEVVIETLDLPPGPRDFELYARQMKRTLDPEWRGRIWTQYHRVENIGRDAGFSYHTWGDHGGESARHLLGMMLEESTPEYRRTYLSEVVRLQTGDPIIIHIINHGLNDRQDTRLSIGPAGQAGAGFVSNTPEGYKDNLQGLIDLITAEHVATGVPETSVFFILMPSHRKGDGENADSRLEGYRDASYALARENPRTCFVNLAALITSQEMGALGYYYGGGGPVNHLSNEGYVALSQLALNAILGREPCRPDLNVDGLVSLADLLSMLSAWGGCPENCPADVDDSGSVDFADLVMLLAAWGECG